MTTTKSSPTKPKSKLDTYRDEMLSFLSITDAKGRVRLKRPVRDVVHEIGYFLDDQAKTSPQALNPAEQLAVTAAVIAHMQEHLERTPTG